MRWRFFDGIYDIDRVCVHIFQPRKSNVVSSMMDKTDLYEWADTELTEKAQLAYEGQGSFSCGEWCRFCKAKAECRERAEATWLLPGTNSSLPHSSMMRRLPTSSVRSML